MVHTGYLDKSCKALSINLAFSDLQLIKIDRLDNYIGNNNIVKALNFMHTVLNIFSLQLCVDKSTPKDHLTYIVQSCLLPPETSIFCSFIFDKPSYTAFQSMNSSHLITI